jgi:hypothetical protein
MSTVAIPAFGDPAWIAKLRKWERWQPLIDASVVVTVSDAVDLCGFCRSGVLQFATDHFGGRWRVPVEELIPFADEPRVSALLEKFLEKFCPRARCRFCGRYPHAKWCIESERPR